MAAGQGILCSMQHNDWYGFGTTKLSKDFLGVSEKDIIPLKCEALCADSGHVTAVSPALEGTML